MHIEKEESTPQTIVLEELAKLGLTLREITKMRLAKREEEISNLQAKIGGKRKKFSSAKMHDMRDMLTVLRKTDFKAEKGRRRDLRKIDDIIGDLKILTETW
mgnify:CR=1 FL=1|jgi:hypothetical protein